MFNCFLLCVSVLPTIPFLMGMDAVAITTATLPHYFWRHCLEEAKAEPVLQREARSCKYFSACRSSEGIARSFRGRVCKHNLCCFARYLTSHIPFADVLKGSSGPQRQGRVVTQAWPLEEFMGILCYSSVLVEGFLCRNLLTAHRLLCRLTSVHCDFGTSHFWQREAAAL